MHILTAVVLSAALLLGTARAALLERDWNRELPVLDEPESSSGISGFGDGIRAPASITPALDEALRAIHAGRYGDVPALVKDSLARPKTAAPAHELLGIAFALQGQLALARGEFESALRANPKQVTALIKLGDLSSAEGKRDEAERHYLRAQALDDQDPQLAQRLGLVAERKADIRQAISWYEKGVRGTPDDYLGVRLNLAGLYNRSGQPARTVALLGEHPKRNGSAVALFHLGVARTQLHDYPGAIADLQRARAIDAKFWNVAVSLGVAQRLGGSVEDSITTLQEAARLAPGSPLAPVELGISLLKAKRPTEAISAFEKAVALSGDRPAFRLELAQAHLAIGDHAKAISLFDALSKLDGAPIEVGLGLAAAHQLAGNLDQTRKVFERLRKASPKNSQVLFHAGLFEAFRRNYDGAIQLLGRASADPSTRPQAMRALAFAYGQKRDYSRALETARKLVGESGDKAGSRLVLAVLLEEAGKTKEATSAYEDVLELDAEQVLALNNLAVLRSVAGDGKSALALAERAHRLAPDNAQVLDTWGWALHRVGRSQDAVAPLTQAARRLPDSAGIRYHLGAARLAIGERGSARNDLAASLELSPDAAWAGEARLLLEGR